MSSSEMTILESEEENLLLYLMLGMLTVTSFIYGLLKEPEIGFILGGTIGFRLLLEIMLHRKTILKIECNKLKVTKKIFFKLKKTSYEVDLSQIVNSEAQLRKIDGYEMSQRNILSVLFPIKDNYLLVYRKKGGGKKIPFFGKDQELEKFAAKIREISG